MQKVKTCAIYIVRHGQTEWNVKGILQGHTDSPLTPLGREQAKMIAQKLKDKKVDVIFSSDLARAKKTARAIAKEHNLKIKTTKALRERYHGELEGKALKGLTNISLLSQSDYEKQLKHFGIEKETDTIERMIGFLRAAATANQGKTVVVVTHGGVMRVLLTHLGYRTRDQLLPGTVANTAHIKIISNGSDLIIEETEGVNA